MKFKIFLMVSLILAILTIGAVSAADGNATSDDVIAQENSIDEVEISQDLSDFKANQEDSIDVMEISDNQSDETLAGQDVGLEVDCPSIIHDFDFVDVYIYMADDAKRDVSIFVDGQEENAGDIDWGLYGIYHFKSLAFGKHTLKVTFLGDEKYDSSSVSTDFYYSYLDVDYQNNDEYYEEFQKRGEGLSIISPSEMKAKVYVDGKIVFDGKINENVIPINNLALGEHTYKIVTEGNGKKYPSITEEGNFTREVHPVLIYPELMIFSDDKNFTVELPSDADGNIQISFNDDIVNATPVNGKVSVPLKDFEIGEYIGFVRYTNGSKYCEYDKWFHFNVIPDPDFKIILPDIIKKGVEAKFKVTGKIDYDGEIEIVDSGGKRESASFSNGKATVAMAFNKVGSNTLKFIFRYLETEYSIGSRTVDVYLNKPVITADNFKADYSSKSEYKVRIKDIDNKYSAGKKVTFVLYEYDYSLGKKVATKTAKTDKNGYAKVKFNVASGKYKVKVKYGGATVSKKYTINSIIKINSIQKYKKITPGVSQLVTSNTINIGATLKKVDGKVLSGKTVKFTFYIASTKKMNKLIKLKTYTAKINNKGVASLTFKNSPIKVSSSQMDSGQVFDVKVSYLDDVSWGAFLLRSKSPFRYYFIG